ncbi:2-methylfumaryl-CoA hydratase [Caulobacter ginsengisoli]|uniref:2-methylfumaryl-CoA hydratase n=1 Tax=Caulobacter ginsengisoli TaxID=400775 RepID=A0ABU0IW08_9CAUL|nr:MaoC family dehydratase [Caulobacter ginsengisoli]MDQ0466193.1 2-methylfumaryl-CoA hydratase [Caulobacter ginsengisoli]
MSKTDPGHYFEDFRLGQTLHHATPRTVTPGDVALYNALYGPRFALTSSDEFARACGLELAPVDPLLAFHMVFGKTVPDISLNAIANLGYAEGLFLDAVYPGDTLTAVSEVIGLKENSNRKTGVVYVRTTGVNQRGRAVLRYVRWVMVRKRDEAAPIPEQATPTLAPAVAAGDLVLPRGIDFSRYDFALAGAPHAFEDYAVGEKIDHVDGMCVEEAEHQLATRLYQNTAKVHFNQYERAKDPTGRRLVYGGVVISTAKALSFNGLQNAGMILGINAGRHVNPYFAGATVFAWSEVLDKADLGPCGALRLRLVATKDRPCADFPDKDETGAYPGEVILDFDYWAAVPKRG